MSLILSGSEGLSDVDGTAATPAIRGTDTNTGIFFPAADTIAFSEGGAEVARFDSVGNFGVGTPNPGTRVDAYVSGTGSSILRARNDGTVVYLDANNGYSYLNTFSNHPMLFGTNNTERMRIDSSGNVGIGTSSPINLLTVQTAATGTTAGSNIIARFQSNAAGRDATLQLSDNVANSATISMVGGAVAVAQNGVERTRIDTSGNFQFNSGYGSVATAYGCRAWVNFNGTGTVAIRASGNVSSITDNGAGKYTVNFASAMPDANYSAVCLNGNGAGYWGYSANIASPVAGSCGFEIATPTGTANTNPAYFDPTTVCIAIFR